jgi:hypothetical protein
MRLMLRIKLVPAPALLTQLLLMLLLPSTDQSCALLV